MPARQRAARRGGGGSGGASGSRGAGSASATDASPADPAPSSRATTTAATTSSTTAPTATNNSNGGSAIKERTLPALHPLPRATLRRTIGIWWATRALLALALLGLRHGVFLVPSSLLQALPSEPFIRESAAWYLAQRTEYEFPLTRRGWSCEAALDGMNAPGPSDPAPASSDAYFHALTAWTCAWDAGHFMWLAEVGYTPDEAVRGMVVSSGPALPPTTPGGAATPPPPLGLQLGHSDAPFDATAGGVVVEDFGRDNHGGMLPAEASGAVRALSVVAAVNGVPVPPHAPIADAMALFAQASANATAAAVAVAGASPGRDAGAAGAADVSARVEVTLLSRPYMWQREAAFFPLFPLAVVRPAVALARAAHALIGQTDAVPTAAPADVADGDDATALREQQRQAAKLRQLRQLRRADVINVADLARVAGGDAALRAGGGNAPAEATTIAAVVVLTCNALSCVAVVLVAAAGSAATTLMAATRRGGRATNTSAMNGTSASPSAPLLPPSLQCLLAFPSAMFLSTVYSETLFLAIAAGWLWALLRLRLHAIHAAAARDVTSLDASATPAADAMPPATSESADSLAGSEQPWALYATAVVLGLLLPLTRGVGLFAAAPALVFAWEQRATTAARGKHADSTRTRARCLSTGATATDAALAAIVAAPAVGYGAYLAWMWVLRGDPFAGMQAQAGFMAGFSVWNVLNPAVLWHELTTARSPHGFVWHSPVDSILDRAVFVAAVTAIGALAARKVRAGVHRSSRGALQGVGRRGVASGPSSPSSSSPQAHLPWFVLCYCGVMCVLPPALGSFMSYTRFALVSAFPLLWHLDMPGPLAARASVPSARAAALRRAALAACCAVGCGLQYVLLARFVAQDWAG